MIRDDMGRPTGRTQWDVRKVEVTKLSDQLIVHKFGLIGWAGNSGFGALNLAVQFGANPIVLVGYDMRLDRGVHWFGLHSGGLTNPHARNVERWRRCVDGCAPLLTGLGIRVFNASPVSWLQNYPKMDLMEALNGPADNPDRSGVEPGSVADRIAAASVPASAPIKHRHGMTHTRYRRAPERKTEA